MQTQDKTNRKMRGMRGFRYEVTVWREDGNGAFMRAHRRTEAAAKVYAQVLHAQLGGKLLISVFDTITGTLLLRLDTEVK